jgi:formylglycine-generating enzyme required for sulfatase activity
MGAGVNTGINPPRALEDGGPRRRQVALPGGTFLMGRDDVPPLNREQAGRPDPTLLWVYAQWPAHAVTVRPFRIDRTEVTNAEYADFVKSTGYPAPPAITADGSPLQVAGSLPVVNVTFEDALAFAAWRSKRDRVAYRLPTEEEWEYAARGQDSRLYPWGEAWGEGRANVGTGVALPVGSFPRGQTPQGVEDMIGNVWEWTSSEAAMYPGNEVTPLTPEDRGRVVVRGGGYLDRFDRDRPVTATTRAFLPKRFRHETLGFRLVSDR